MVLTLSGWNSVYAQGGPPAPPGGAPSNHPGKGKGPPCWPKPCNPPANIPIDNGIEYLVLAGILLGARKSYHLYKGKMAG